MSKYSRGSNWSSSGGTYRNGHSQTITNPPRYFASVGDNRHGYNSGYSNGRGETVNNPPAYYRAVGNDSHGYNGTKK